MAVEIPRFWAWIVANSPTEFRRDDVVTRNVLNEGTPKRKRYNGRANSNFNGNYNRKRLNIRLLNP